MKKTWMFYRLSDGAILPQSIGTSDATMVAANTPEGCTAIEGRFDSESQRVDLATGTVADWRPPSPGNDYEWDAEIRRHVKKPEAFEREQRGRVAQRDIDTSEQQQARAVREALLELLPADSPARARLEDIDQTIAAKRDDLAAGAKANDRQK